MNTTSMKQETAGPRRIFIRRAWQSCAALFGAAFAFKACGKQEKQGEDIASTSPSADCADLSAVNEKDVTVREKLGYVKESPLADNQCQNCNLYLPPKSGEACGGCMLFKGPVFAEAYCTYWAPKI